MRDAASPPDWRAIVRARLEHAALEPVHEAGIVEEFAQHMDDRYRGLLARGVPEPDARRAALAEIESHQPLARAIADRADPRLPAPPVGGPPRRLFAGLLQDFRYALRLLRRSPTFTLAVIVTVALSTGPTIGALGLANWLFVRPLPGVADAGRLATVVLARWRGDSSWSPRRLPQAEAERFRSVLQKSHGLAGCEPQTVTVAAGSLDPRVAPAEFVSANFFDVLGVRLQAGRPFDAEEDRAPGGAPVAIVSGSLARSFFGSAGAAVGRAVQINNLPFSVIGVAADAFQGTSLSTPADVWLTAMTLPRANHFPPARWTYEPDRGPLSRFIVRLAPGATFQEAEQELQLRVRALRAPGAGLLEDIDVRVYQGVGVEGAARGRLWDVLRILLWVGGTLIALGVANLANLFAFRATSRGREAAVRRALGASAARLARLPVIEAVVLATAGGLLGLALVVGLRAWLAGSSVLGFGVGNIALDWRLFATTIGVSLLVGCALGTLPAQTAIRADLGAALGRSGRAATRPNRLRSTLAVTQVALSLVLVAGALLFVTTLRNLQHVDLGFDPAGVHDVRLTLRQQGYVGPRALGFQKQVLSEVAADRAIAAASLATYPPFAGVSFTQGVHLPGQDPKSARTVTINAITPDYFRTLGLPLVSGRTFEDSEEFRSGPEAGVVLSEALARQLFGTADVLGRLVTFPATLAAPSHDVPVIGIARDAHWTAFDKPELLMYRPVADADPISALLVRATLSPDEALAHVRTAVRRIDPGVPVSVGTMEQSILDRLNQQRLMAWVLSTLAAIGFLLAAVGIHGLVSQTVAERMREFGIRRAIGAGTAQVVALVSRQAIVVAAIGLPIGIGVARLASKLIERQLFGVRATAPAVYLVSALVLAAVVGLGSIGPARRATAVDPADVLRSE